MSPEKDINNPPPSLKPITDNGKQHNFQSSFIQRLLVITAVKILRRFRSQQGSVLFVSDDICIKHGPLKMRHLAEASTMRFIANNTTVPVPKIHCAFTHKDSAYIVMERIHGEALGLDWVSQSDDYKSKILSQLKAMVAEIRTIPPSPDQGVSNVDGGPIWDCRLPGDSVFHGPFLTIDLFHKYLRAGFDPHPDHFPEVSELIQMQTKNWGQPVFTHGDLSSLNVLIRKGDIVGLIDWESAGWYPSYWEYTTAHQVNIRNLFWREEVDKFLEARPEELKMEGIRQKYFGDV